MRFIPKLSLNLIVICAALFFTAPTRAEFKFCDLAGTQGSELDVLMNSPMLRVDLPTDPDFFANFGIKTRKEYNRQVRLVESLQGKVIMGFTRDTISQTNDVVILSAVDMSYENFQKNGLSLNLASGGKDGYVFHAYASLRQILTHARRIQNWNPPPRLGTEFPLPVMNPTLDPLQRSEAVPGPPSENRSFFEWRDEENPTGLTEQLTELSLASNIRLYRDDIAIKQVYRLDSKNNDNPALKTVYQLRGDIRVVEATSLKSGNKIKEFMRVVTDESGRMLLLMSRDCFGDKQNLLRLNREIESVIREQWLESVIGSWIRTHEGDQASVEYYFSANPKLMLSEVGIGALKPATPHLQELFSKKLKGVLDSNGIDIVSTGVISEQENNPILKYMNKSLAKNGGRIEVVEYRNRANQKPFVTQTPFFDYDIHGHPMMVVTRETLGNFLYIYWVEYLNTLNQSTPTFRTTPANTQFRR